MKCLTSLTLGPACATFCWVKTWAPGFCLLLGPLWKLPPAFASSLGHEQPKWKALPVHREEPERCRIPGSPRFLFIALLSRHLHLEPRELADLPHPDPCLPRLCSILPHRNLPFCLFWLCFSLWESGCLCRCLSPALRRPPGKGSEGAYSGAWSELLAYRQVTPGKLISFRLVSLGRLLHFLVVHPRPPDVLTVTTVTASL